MKRAIYAFIYYIIAFGIILFCGKYYKTGPCTLNWDIISLLIFIPVSLGLLIYNSIKWIRVGKIYLGAICVHGIVCSAMFLFFRFKAL